MTATSHNRCVCIHAHFYQPPRENPWLEAVEAQDSAAPYHDWNERVAAQCYAPNARARLLDAQQRIVRLVNNYEHVSFNIGPTLMSWLAANAPETYAAIQRADRESVRRLGHGNAIAQAYGHAIMPLADARDRVTQVRWGIRDFEHRFARRPEGMWLPETAVDNASLRVLAEHGIRFTILAPHQAARVRRAGSTAWEDLGPHGIDSRRAYRWHSGKAELALFFYDHDLAHGVAFSGLLNDGAAFAQRLLGGFAPAAAAPQLVHLATDGESYGHHHRFGEMALAYAIQKLAAESAIELTNYAAFLARGGVLDEVQIIEESSWSCVHGIERWRSDCGCNSGGHPGWRQTWRKPLREALHWLKDEVDRRFEDSGALLPNPWAARDAYIEVLLDRSNTRRTAFLAAHARPGLTPKERVRVWKLLEMQRAALLMFTSCGWFFDDLSGLETTQVLRYAGRAMQLAAEVGPPLEPDFLARLDQAHSNLPGRPGGRQIYRQQVAPAAVTLPRAAAHAVLSSVFATAGELPAGAYTYRFESLERVRRAAGSATLALGSVRVQAEITEEAATYAYAALYLGGHDAHCAIGGPDVLSSFPDLPARLAAVFAREPLSAVVRAIDAVFGAAGYSLRDLFQAQRRAILHGIAAQAFRPCVSELEQVFDQHRRMLDFLRETDVPVPEAFREVAHVVLQERLMAAVHQLAAGDNSFAAVAALWEDAGRWEVKLPLPPLTAALEEGLRQVMTKLAADAPAQAGRAEALLDAAALFGVTLNLWAAQNAYYDFASGGAPATALALPLLRRLRQRLGFAPLPPG
ncbi:MAG: DUF3536 domain-containing protein [Deltaproteobacteria bacterium]|nr:DUF3536 domain-containing protein [Deltaproteobacteria bacterium]